MTLMQVRTTCTTKLAKNLTFEGNTKNKMVNRNISLPNMLAPYIDQPVCLEHLSLPFGKVLLRLHIKGVSVQCL